MPACSRRGCFRRWRKSPRRSGASPSQVSCRATSPKRWLRLFAGFVLAAVIGVTVGIAMGRSKRAQDYLLPLVSIGAPIPGIAYAPLIMLWFGLGNFSAILIVGFVSAFPVIFNTWTGVKAVKEIWVRSAQAMGADQRRLFRHVILPGALPYIFTGLRLGLRKRGASSSVGCGRRRCRCPTHRAGWAASSPGSRVSSIFAQGLGVPPPRRTPRDRAPAVDEHRSLAPRVVHACDAASRCRRPVAAPRTAPSRRPSPRA